MSEVLVCQSCQHAFRKVTESGITLDYCESCNLIWFDEFELERYCLSQSISLLRDDQAFTEDSNSLCPKCSQSLLAAKIVPESRLQFGACRYCRGYLVASELIDSQFPDRPRKVPFEQLADRVSTLDLLGNIFYWFV